jgi:hypothetical protein
MPILFDLLLVIFLCWFFLSQLIIPTIKGTPTFPAIRRAPTEKLVNEIKTVDEELEAADLAAKLEDKKEQLTKKRAPKKPQQTKE